MEIIIGIIALIIGVAAGFGLARYVVNSSIKQKLDAAELRVEDAKREAESIKREAKMYI